jgi:hypothetical protein
LRWDQMYSFLLLFWSCISYYLKHLLRSETKSSGCIFRNWLISLEPNGSPVPEVAMTLSTCRSFFPVRAVMATASSRVVRLRPVMDWIFKRTQKKRRVWKDLKRNQLRITYLSNGQWFISLSYIIIESLRISNHLRITIIINLMKVTISNGR